MRLKTRTWCGEWSPDRFSRVNERREKSAHPLLNGVLEVAE